MSRHLGVGGSGPGDLELDGANIGKSRLLSGAGDEAREWHEDLLTGRAVARVGNGDRRRRPIVGVGVDFQRGRAGMVGAQTEFNPVLAPWLVKSK